MEDELSQRNGGPLSCTTNVKPSLRCKRTELPLRRFASKPYMTIEGDAPQGVYVFYLELVTDMLHLFVYVIFFIIVFTNYGLPLHLVRAWAPFLSIIRLTCWLRNPFAINETLSTRHEKKQGQFSFYRVLTR